MTRYRLRSVEQPLFETPHANVLEGGFEWNRCRSSTSEVSTSDSDKSHNLTPPRLQRGFGLTRTAHYCLYETHTKFADALGNL